MARVFQSCHHQPGACYPGAGSQVDLGGVTSALGFPLGAVFGEIDKPRLLGSNQLAWASPEAFKVLSLPSALFPWTLPRETQAGWSMFGMAWGTRGEVKVFSHWV